MSKLSDITEEYGMKTNTKNKSYGYSEERKQEIKDKNNNKRRWNRTSKTVPMSRKYHKRGCTMWARNKNRNCNGLSSRQRTKNASIEGMMMMPLWKTLIKALIWSIALQKAETWALKKVDIQRQDAFEMWLWRKILHINWTYKITSQRVPQQVEDVRV